MRVTEVVSSMFRRPDFIQKANFLSQMRGGWERWFQLELAYYIATQYSSLHTVTLEDTTVYDQPALRADLTITSPVLSKTTTVVELKCQIAGTDAGRFYQLVDADIQKVLQSKLGHDYQTIALVWNMADLKEIGQTLVFKYHDQVQPYIFDSSLKTPAGFISFYKGAG